MLIKISSIKPQRKREWDKGGEYMFVLQNTLEIVLYFKQNVFLYFFFVLKTKVYF